MTKGGVKTGPLPLKKDPFEKFEKQRKYTMIASALGAAFFMTLVIVSFFGAINNLVTLGTGMIVLSGKLDKAETLDFPLNETRTALAFSEFSFIAPLYFISFALFVLVGCWTATWVGRLLKYFWLAYTRQPTGDDLRKFVTTLYKTEEMKIKIGILKEREKGGRKS